jgi:hypothetical protein
MKKPAEIEILKWPENEMVKYTAEKEIMKKMSENELMI